MLTRRVFPFHVLNGDAGPFSHHAMGDAVRALAAARLADAGDQGCRSPFIAFADDVRGLFGGLRPCLLRPAPARHAARLPVAPVPDWSKLSRDDAVRVLLLYGRIIPGRIDMIAVDRSVLWVIQSAGRGRVMVCSSDRPAVVRAATAGSPR
jgi:hypothetical protein